MNVRRALGSLLLLATLSAVGCAHGPQRGYGGGVPIDQRPTPSPPPDTTVEGTPGGEVETGEAEAPTNDPVQEVISAEERRATLARIVADTTAASGAVKRCASKTLLPDQESVFETTRSYLVQARAALRREELWQAESLARKARQLALSLECH